LKPSKFQHPIMQICSSIIIHKFDESEVMKITNTTCNIKD